MLSRQMKYLAAIAVLVVGAILILAIPRNAGTRGQNPYPGNSLASSAVAEVADDRHSNTTGPNDESLRDSASSIPINGSSREELTESLLQPLLSENLELQKLTRDEVVRSFQSFLDLFPEERRGPILVALSDAYVDIQLIGLAIEQDRLLPEEIAAIKNPNHVFDRVSLHLHGEEIDLLEQELEARAKRSFSIANDTQLALMPPGLSSDSQKQLLDKLFTETYALTTPNGIGYSASLADRLNNQLRAAELTRESLRGTLPADQFVAVDAYLREREAALGAAAIIFD